MKPETKAIHVPGKSSDGTIARPIQLSTTFEHGPANERIHGYEYIRDANPNVNDLEARLAAMEGGIGARVFSSGMAAGTALLNTLPSGSTIVFHDTIYFDFLQLGRRQIQDWGLEARFVDCRDERALKRVLDDGAALVWIESPTNPTLDLIDIKAVAGMAAASGARTIVDGTFATTALQQPLALGADFVLHSTTKYMGGHSDVQGGALIVGDDDTALDELTRVRKLTGGVLAPFNAWLTSRGLQTLHCRMDRHCDNALTVATSLAGHSAIARVRYPYLPSSPDFALAKTQMKAGGGMVSFDLTGGREAALNVASAVRLFVNATSLGGVESLIEHRASVEGPSSQTPDGLLRLSVGLEHSDDLLEDLALALGQA